MRVVCLTRAGRDYSRAVEDYNEGLRRRFAKEMEMIDADSAEGERLARALDVTLMPTILAMDGQGSVQASWRGMPLPLMDEVGYYLAQAD